MQFEYYVLNCNPNTKKIEPFNIFRNCYVQEYTEKAIKKYLRSPKNYKYERYGEDTLYENTTGGNTSGNPEAIWL